VSSDTDKPGLFEELKRRNVFRVAAMYAVVAWLVVQIADATFEPLGISDGAHRILILLAALGFPVALVLRWIFDWTSEGLVRTADDPEKEVARLRSSRRIDYAIIGALILILAMALFGPGMETPAESASPIRSIAVLPFDDLSPEGDQQYFVEGLSEEIINALSQIPDLKVASRTSTFLLAEQGADIATVAGTLGVANVLEGSVRKSGNRIRITAQLIEAESGFHLWSERIGETSSVLAHRPSMASSDREASGPKGGRRGGCTDDACNPASGCIFVANSVSCEDGSVCTTGDFCSAGSCVSGSVLDCDDFDVCTADACDEIDGCTHTAIPGCGVPLVPSLGPKGRIGLVLFLGSVGGLMALLLDRRRGVTEGAEEIPNRDRLC
jgi:TolB-like protein